MQGHVPHSKVVTARQIWPAGQLLDGQSVRWWMIFKSVSYWQIIVLLAVGWPPLFGACSETCDSKSKPFPRNLYSLDNSAGPIYSPCTHASVLSLLASVVPCWICTNSPCIICPIISFDRHQYWYCLQLRFLKKLGSSLCFNFRWSDICDCNSPQNGHGLLPAKIADTSDLSLGLSFMCLASCDYNTPQYRKGFLTCSDLFGCSSLVGEEFGQSLLGKEPLLLGFTAADFFGCSLSTAGNHEQSDLDEEPVAWGSTEWFLGCSSSTGEKLGHSKLEGGSAVSGITEAEFLGCSLFTKQKLGQSESGTVHHWLGMDGAIRVESRFSYIWFHCSWFLWLLLIRCWKPGAVRSGWRASWMRFHWGWFLWLLIINFGQIGAPRDGGRFGNIRHH